MQSTGQTSRQASHPVQLSALITATSLGSFLRDPLFAILIDSLNNSRRAAIRGSSENSRTSNSINNDSTEQFVTLKPKPISHNCESERGYMPAIQRLSA